MIVLWSHLPAWETEWVGNPGNISNAGQEVVDIFNLDELWAPGRQIVGSDTAECSFQVLVGFFCLAVGLGMKTRSDTQQDSEGEIKKLAVLQAVEVWEEP